MPEHEELLARLRKLEDENRRLSDRIDELTEPAEPVSRRGLLRRAGQVALGAAALSVGVEAVTAPSAAAADVQPLLQGVVNTATQGTTLSANGTGIGAAAFTVVNIAPGLHKGVLGGIDATGDYGMFGNGGRAGVIGSCPRTDHPRSVTTPPAGVVGTGADGTNGVLGISGNTSGLPVQPAAVTGDSQNQNGVQGYSLNARGGVFAGGQAAISLLPGSLAGAPSTGQNGDLYVDSAGGLWYFRNGWRQLA